MIRTMSRAGHGSLAVRAVKSGQQDLRVQRTPEQVGAAIAAPLQYDHFGTSTIRGKQYARGR